MTDQLLDTLAIAADDIAHAIAELCAARDAQGHDLSGYFRRTVAKLGAIEQKLRRLSCPFDLD